jgi:hypothetical protein
MAFGEIGVEGVVGLPADDVGVAVEMAGQGLGDAAGVFAEGRVAGAGVLARPMALGLAGRIHPQHFRMLLGEPAWGCGGGGGEQGGDAVARQGGDGLVEEGEIEVVLRRLQQAPGELAHADEGDAGGGHPFRVVFPGFGVPQFRIVGDAVPEAAKVGGAAM